MNTNPPESPKIEVIGATNNYGLSLRIGNAPPTTYQMSITNPVADTHLEWMLRHGEDLNSDPKNVRFVAASVVASYDYLLSDQISMKEAALRL